MTQIAQKVEERKGGKISSFEDAINKFCNALKMIFSFGLAGIKDRDIKGAIKEMEKVSEKFKNPEIKEEGNKLNEVVGKFTSMVSEVSNSSRSREL